MPTAIRGDAKIRSNIKVDDAYNELVRNIKDMAQRQLRLSTGKRIDSAGDDVTGYLTSNALSVRSSGLKKTMELIGDAINSSSVTEDSLDNIRELIEDIKKHAAKTISSSKSISEKIPLDKTTHRLSQQIQFVTDSTVFGGTQLTHGAFSASWIDDNSANSDPLSIGLDLSKAQDDLNIQSKDFDLNAIKTELDSTYSSYFFEGVTGLRLEDLSDVTADDLGLFSQTKVSSTLFSLSLALDNIAKVGLDAHAAQKAPHSQSDTKEKQDTNYTQTNPRIHDSDLAQVQVEFMKSQLKQKTSLISLGQANYKPHSFLNLFQ